jgi:mono/diheme cytochrome c family protein
VRLGRRSAALTALLLAALAAGCGEGPSQRAGSGQAVSCGSRLGLPAAEGSALLVEGTRVFDERCTPCHGETGYGDGVLADLLPVRPRNYHADPFKWGTSWPDIQQTVRLGRSDVMPSFEGALSEPEIRAVSMLVACWVVQRERRGGEARAAAR